MLRLGVVQLGQAGVEGGGLARTGGPGHQHHAEGRGDGLVDVVDGLLLHAEVGQVEVQVALVQDTHHDLLPEDAGQGRDTQIDLLVADLQLDAAVLGNAALGDIQLGHDLQPADDGVLQLDRRLHDLVQHAVDAVADPHVLLVGLDVDVAGARS